jgi:hypothetical protein
MEETSLAVEQSNWLTGNREVVCFSHFGTGYWSFFPAITSESWNGMARAVSPQGTKIDTVNGRRLRERFERLITPETA